MYEDAKFLEKDSLCLEAQVPIGITLSCSLCLGRAGECREDDERR